MHHKQSRSRRAVVVQAVAAPLQWRRHTPSQAPPSQPALQQRNLAQQAWANYVAALQRRPLLVKSISALVCTMLGDGLAQGLAHTAPYCLWRSLELGLYSACVGAVVGHHWNSLLDRAVGPTCPTAAATVAKKVALDQLACTPVMTAVWLSFLCACVEGQPWCNMVPFVQAKLLPTLMAGWALWPAVCAISFRFVPRDLRVLFCNVVGIGWGAYLSFSSFAR